MRFEDAQLSVQTELDSEGDFELVGKGLESSDFGFEWEHPSDTPARQSPGAQRGTPGPGAPHCDSSLPRRT